MDLAASPASMRGGS